MRAQSGILACVVGLCLMACQTEKQEPLANVIERGLTRSAEQALLMAKELENQEGLLPKTLKKDGTLATSDYNWWCCGFFPGELWYLYENNPSPELKKYAEMFTDRVEPVKNKRNTHDLGFMINCSFGNGYRLTKNPHYLEVMETGAHSLASRYSSTVCAIRSWDFNRNKWQFPVIIDNMMNLEFLTNVARLTGDTQFEEIANSHAKTTMAHHFRPDYSSYHVVSYDTITGLPHIKQTHQGYSDESAWARGQAWAIYGYAMMARETGNTEYLEQAKNVAKFIMNHPRLPEDKVPYWDFDSPEIPETVRDASAAAIIASGLIELSQLDSSDFGGQCLELAEQMIRSLTSPEYLAETGTNGNFVLKHSTGSYPSSSEVDVPLSYADYYYVEALMRLKKLIQ
ncbi:glycoside hydrolase family 88 protein [Parabacteroides sp. OttesenSCG-928-G06]|nr:glycoside hydrolase family 88 protein [Parabacteroides sp. OttesenSCG-928-G06]